MTNKALMLLAIAGLTIALTSAAQASSADPTANLIQNPDFMSTGASSPVQLNVPAPGGGSRDPGFSRGANLTDWTVKGFALLFGPNPSSPSGTNADFGTGADNQFVSPGAGGFCLYGPGACGGNVPPSVQSPPNRLSLGPSGGNFLALDGEQGAISHSGVACTGGGSCSYEVQASISQTITGLKVGVPTTVDFNWAAGQQATFPGGTFSQLQVSLCPTSDLASCPTADKLLTPEISNPHRGFQQWRNGDFTFDPSTSTEVLTFLAIGRPNPLPPFALLDGKSLSLTQQTVGVPEPGTGPLLLIGLAAMAGLAYRRRRRRDPA
jgi:hypothetical protein